MPETILLEVDEPLDLDATLGCGQAFRWIKRAGWWEGVVERHAIRLRQNGRRLEFRGADASFIRQYLSLDLDLEAVISSIDRDPVIHAAIEEVYGLRILRQPLFECLISYLCATNTNIRAVQARVEAIASHYGERIIEGSKNCHAFPAPLALSGATDEGLRACRLGYRAAFAARTLSIFTADPGWLSRLSAQPYEEARGELMALPGIGPKVADCICLFALEQYESFPVDVWVRRIVGLHYPPGIEEGPAGPMVYEELRAFGRGRFGRFAGYAQEYLYGARHRLCPKRDSV